MERQWVKHDGALCMHGYPIRIEKTPGKWPFFLHVEAREPAAYMTLAYAKLDANRIADELDEFADA